MGLRIVFWGYLQYTYSVGKIQKLQLLNTVYECVSLVGQYLSCIVNCFVYNRQSRLLLCFQHNESLDCLFLYRKNICTCRYISCFFIVLILKAFLCNNSINYYVQSEKRYITNNYFFRLLEIIKYDKKDMKSVNIKIENNKAYKHICHVVSSYCKN